MPSKPKRGELLDWVCTFLESYGYLKQSEAKKVQKFDDLELKAALAKYQRLDANVARLKAETNEPMVADGEWGPATHLAMQMPRCQMIDTDEEPATGTGGWQGCLREDEHGAVVEVDQTNLPAFLRPHFVTVLRNVQHAYAQMGMLFLFRDKSNQNDLIVGGKVEGRTHIDFTFTRGNGWIGLAIVGPGTCGRSIWCRYDYRYNPSNVVREWVTLVKHELGHNCGLRHSSGGVMNPSIVPGLPTEWAASDPSTPTLKRWFSGVPVDVPGGPEPPTPGPQPPPSGWPPPPGQPASDTFQMAGKNFRIYREFGS